MGIYEGIFGSLIKTQEGRSRAINYENKNGEKGRACMVDSNLGHSRKGSPCIRTVEPGQTVSLMDIDGTGIINHIWMTFIDRVENELFILRNIILRMYWDNEDRPSVEVPLGDFFCCGFGRSVQVNSLPICVNPNRAMNCYFQMPFRTHARIEIENQNEVTVPAFFFQINYRELDSLPEDTAYFHAYWNREPQTQLQKDYTVIHNITGRGHYVGTYLAIATLQRYWYGEGEFKFYIDGDKEYPTICSTGTEDYFGGAWSFGAKDGNGSMYEKTFCTPFLGYPYISRDDSYGGSDYWMNDKPMERGFYRFHIADPIIFEHDLRVELQQIGTGPKGLYERSDDVSSVAYWYQTEPHAAYPEMLPRELRIPR